MVSTEEEKLVARFVELGANDPGAWAESELRESIPQLHRFVFLKTAYEHLVAQEEDQGWAQRSISRQDSGKLGTSLKKAQGHGATQQELVDLARAAQAQLLYELCQLLEGNQDQEPLSVQWGLFVTDKSGIPRSRIAGLHESVLEMDPTGREMRPRKPESPAGEGA